VGRDEELDDRTLYSKWLAQSFEKKEFLDFAAFRQMVQEWLAEGRHCLDRKRSALSRKKKRVPSTFSCRRPMDFE